MKDLEREIDNFSVLACLSMMIVVLYIEVKGPLKLMADNMS